MAGHRVPAGPNVPSVIYWLTALVVLAYTVETYGMRQEMVRQNETAVQPVLIILVERHYLALRTVEAQVFLRNIGRGPALFVTIADLTLIDPIGEVQFVARFEAPDLVEAGDLKQVTASMTYVTKVAEPNPRHWTSLQASTRQRHARRTT
jgi:hypothetical protein